MNTARMVRRTIVTLGLSLAVAASAAAQGAATQQKPFEPKVGQEGKDVVWVPTPQATVDRMLELARITPQDFLMDLGSGDGVTVITAAKRGTRALGVEYNPEMVELARKRAQEAGVADMATFVQGDLFKTDFSKATVITMFLLPRINLELRPKLLELKPGTRLVSNTFTMDDWQADETAQAEGECTSWCTALLWIVPAKVEGTWDTPKGPLVLKQQFQMVSGTLGGQPIADGRLRGEEITFTVGGAKFTGTVSGNQMTGTGDGGSWTATRK